MFGQVLVTGGAGFVGSSLALAIKAEYPLTNVVAFDNLRRRGSELNLERLRCGEVRFVHGDVRVLEDLAGLRPAPDLIIECSAEPSVLAGYGGSPQYVIDCNLLGCFHCLELARRVKAAFVFVSTSRVYPVELLNRLHIVEGASRFSLAPDQPFPGVSALGISEDFPLDGPRSLYGMTKLAAELMVEEYGDAYGIDYVIDRCGLLTGPWQMGKSDQGVIVLWLAAHWYNRPLSYIGFGGAGKQVRDFLHIGDFVNLILRQISAFPIYNRQRFNVGGGTQCSVSLNELTDLCREITGRYLEINSEPATRKADVPVYVTDARRISALSGWAPRHDARKTLSDIFEWLKANTSQLEPVLAH